MTPEKIEAARKLLAEKLESKRKVQYAPPPRYDEEFFEGLKWLDSL